MSEMGARLYYDDSYATTFTARVTGNTGDPARVLLDGSLFYPTSGGQPFDTGSIGEARVVDVIEEGDRVVHVLDRPLAPGEYDAAIDWHRRFDHMQQHTGQHLLSAVLAELHSLVTVSFHLGAAVSTIDLDASEIAPGALEAAEQRANAAIHANRSVRVEYREPRAAGDLRKASAREGVLRIVTIEGIDASACGGTHVRETGEIGAILLRKAEKIRGNTRLEFVCGGRAIAAARRDFELATRTARVFSCAPEDAPAMAAAQAARLAESEKARHKLALELARIRGRDAYASAPVNCKGWRVHIRRATTGAVDDELRAEAQAFVEQGPAVFAAVMLAGPAILLAAANGTLDAGAAMKQLLATHGGRGGGNPRLAQASAASEAALDALAAELTALLG